MLQNYIYIQVVQKKQIYRDRNNIHGDVEMRINYKQTLEILLEQ